MARGEDVSGDTDDRTLFAEDRTLLASERTFGGWVRTSLAALGVAIGMRAVFRGFEPEWLAKAVATIFVLAAVAMVVWARGTYRNTRSRLDSHSARPQPRRNIDILSALLLVAALATGGILWAL